MVKWPEEYPIRLTLIVLAVAGATILGDSLGFIMLVYAALEAYCFVRGPWICRVAGSTLGVGFWLFVSTSLLHHHGLGAQFGVFISLAASLGCLWSIFRVTLKGA